MIDGELFGEFVAVDVRDEDLHRVVAGADVVYHLAGIAALPRCQARPGFAYDVNVTGTANVLEASRRAGIRRVVLSSTSAVYECSVGDTYAETTPIAPNLVYACTKKASEDLCSAYAANYGMDIVVARLFNVYGPHQDFRRQSPPFTSYVARELAAQRTPTLYNDSQVKRDYVFAADVVSALMTMGLAPGRYAAEILNVGSGAGHSVPELYALFQKTAGTSIAAAYRKPESLWDAYEELYLPPFPLSRERVKKEVYKHAIADVRKIRREFGWTPATSIEQGVAAVFAYAVAHARDVAHGDAGR